MEAAGEARAADIHDRVIEAELLISLAAQALEIVGDAPIHRRSRQEPDVAAARTPFEEAELAHARNAGESIDRDLQRRNGASVVVGDVARFAALPEHVADALNLRFKRRRTRPIEGAGHIPGAEAMALAKPPSPLVRDRAFAARRLVLRALAFGPAQIKVVGNPKQCRHEVRQFQWTAELDDRFQIVIVGKCEVE